MAEFFRDVRGKTAAIVLQRRVQAFVGRIAKGRLEEMSRCATEAKRLRACKIFHLIERPDFDV